MNFPYQEIDRLSTSRSVGLNLSMAFLGTWVNRRTNVHCIQLLVHNLFSQMMNETVTCHLETRSKICEVRTHAVMT